jgi:TetR/AcrR family transcriptional repressor of nem operon
MKNTKSKALEEGMALLQMHGYHGFSFQDIADKLKIKKPSLYDHFGSKEELIIAIIQDYTDKFETWFVSIDEKKPIEKIRKIFEVFFHFSSDKSKVCPILALTTDLKGLSILVLKELKIFVDKWLNWLELLIVDGQRRKEIRTDLDSKLLASFIYSLLMGAQLQAKIKKNPGITLESCDQIISLIKI